MIILRLLLLPIIVALIVLECCFIVVFAVLLCVFVIFRGTRRFFAAAIGKLASWIAGQFRFLIGAEKEDDVYHPLKKNGSWDKRFKINRY